MLQDEILHAWAELHEVLTGALRDRGAINHNTQRIKAIDTLQGVIGETPDPPERKLQGILETTPWLVRSEWTVFQANDTLERLRRSFEKWYQKKTGKVIVTSFDPTASGKRPDFIMLSFGRSIEIIEIKRPGHRFGSEDFRRMHLYYEKIREYLEENSEFQKSFPQTNMTLVCDDVVLSGVDKTAYDSLVAQKTLVRKTWAELLGDAKEANRDFLKAKESLFKRYCDKECR